MDDKKVRKGWKQYWLCATSLILFACLGCTEAYPQPSGERPEVGTRVSIVEVLSGMKERQGERVTIRGVLSKAEGGYALYAGRREAAYENKKYGLWLGELSYEQVFMNDRLENMDAWYVEVTGKLNQQERGPGGEYFCEIQEVEIVDTLEIQSDDYEGYRGGEWAERPFEEDIKFDRDVLSWEEKYAEYFEEQNR